MTPNYYLRSHELVEHLSVQGEFTPENKYKAIFERLKRERTELAKVFEKMDTSLKGKYFLDFLLILHSGKAQAEDLEPIIKSSDAVFLESPRYDEEIEESLNNLVRGNPETAAIIDNIERSISSDPSPNNEDDQYTLALLKMLHGTQKFVIVTDSTKEEEENIFTSTHIRGHGGGSVPESFKEFLQTHYKQQILEHVLQIYARENTALSKLIDAIRELEEKGPANERQKVAVVFGAIHASMHDFVSSLELQNITADFNFVNHPEQKRSHSTNFFAEEQLILNQLRSEKTESDYTTEKLRKAWFGATLEYYLRFNPKLTTILNISECSQFLIELQDTAYAAATEADFEELYTSLRNKTNIATTREKVMEQLLERIDMRRRLKKERERQVRQWGKTRIPETE